MIPPALVFSVKFWPVVATPLVTFTVPTATAAEVVMLTAPTEVLTATMLTGLARVSVKVPAPSSSSPAVVVIKPAACVTPAAFSDTYPAPALIAWLIVIPPALVFSVKFWPVVATPLVAFTVPTATAAEVVMLTAPVLVATAIGVTGLACVSVKVPTPSS